MKFEHRLYSTVSESSPPCTQSITSSPADRSHAPIATLALQPGQYSDMGPLQQLGEPLPPVGQHLFMMETLEAKVGGGSGMRSSGGRKVAAEG